MRLLWWTNIYTLICFCLLLLMSLRLAFSSCVTAPFLLGLFWGLPRSHRLSSHSRLNAFVIQTKLFLQNHVSLGHIAYYLPVSQQPLSSHRLLGCLCKYCLNICRSITIVVRDLILLMSISCRFLQITRTKEAAPSSSMLRTSDKMNR